MNMPFSTSTEECKCEQGPGGGYCINFAGGHVPLPSPPGDGECQTTVLESKLAINNCPTMTQS